MDLRSVSEELVSLIRRYRSRRSGTTRKTLLSRDVLPPMSESTRVTEKGQATIPKELREKYDLDPGDEVVWIDTDEGIVVKKRTRTGARGLLVPEDTPDEKREAVAEELSRRLRNRRDRNYEDA
jgi:AbrB family looped-hinge helix DNA binding protein